MNLPIILDPLREMAYPAAFNMETLKSLPSYEKRLQYAESHLEKLASGSARTVFKIDEEKVLKVAKNKKGLAQNQAESDWGAQQYEVIAQTFNRDDDGLFIEMEYAKKVTPTIFKKVTGISINDLHSYLQNLHQEQYPARYRYRRVSIDPTIIEAAQTNDWVQSLVSFILDYEYPYPGDFSRLSTYGLINRDGKPVIVVIDFGLTQDVMDTYYTRR